MIQNIESTDIDNLDDHVVRSPWEMGMIPNLAARKLGYQFQLRMLSSWALSLTVDRGVTTAENAQAIVSDVLSGRSTYLEKLPEFNPKLKLLAGKKYTDRSEIADVSSFSVWGVCAYYQNIKSAECYSELSRIMEVMAPVDGITARDRIYQVLKNQKYQEPLSRLALEYLEIIEKGLPLQGRKLDEDLMRVLGTESMKWNVLAVLSARGANFYKLLEYSSKNDFRTLVALGVISSASLYFDSLNHDLFSFPRGVKVDCDSGKSYHFWMTAYLARRFGSKWAAYLTDVGYQMKSKTEFRNPNRAFTDRWNSVANQKIRLDLAYSAAGAKYGEFERNQFFGSNEAESFRFDIDEVTDVLEENSEKLPSISNDQANDLWNNYELGAFIRWNKIFRPEAAMY